MGDLTNGRFCALNCHDILEDGPMTRRSWLMMALLAATWGASYMFIKVGLRDFGAGPVVCARTALAAAVLLPVAVRQRTLGQLRGHAVDVLVLALLQVAVPFLLITIGERWIASNLAGILVASAPIWIALISLATGSDDRLTTAGYGGVLVGMLGVGLLFGVDLSSKTSALVGGAMVLLAGLGYGVGAMELRRRMPGTAPAAIASATMGTSALLTLPLVALDPPTQVHVNTAACILTLGLLGTGLAFLVFYALINELGPSRSSLVAYLAPGFSVFYGVSILGEDLTVGTVVGLVLIVGGSYVGATGKTLRRSAPSRSSAPAPARAR